MNKMKWTASVLFTAAAIAGVTLNYTGLGASQRPQPPPQTPKYIVLGWNNLGMHCYDPDFSNIGILPPYNTIVAQVIKVSEPPQIITSGITVEYSFPDNTYSVTGPGVPPDALIKQTSGNTLKLCSALVYLRTSG